MWFTLSKYLLLIAGGAPLIIYPAAMIASVMGLGGYEGSGTPTWQTWLSKTFHLGVLAYPVAFLTAATFAMKGVELVAIYWALAPLVYLGVLYLLFQFVLA